MTPHEFLLLRDYIKTHCGITINTDKGYLIESRLAHLLAETGCSDFSVFYFKAKQDATGQLRDRIIDAITTHETLWFRDVTPWLVLRDVILPQFRNLLLTAQRSRIRIWCTACSTGQEPYSLAILIDQVCNGLFGGDIRPEQFEIVGTDISPGTLFVAKSGRYNQLAISRGLDDPLIARYFAPKGHVWEIAESIRKRVTFLKFNLLDSFAPIGDFDLILCRNVAIYFAEDFKKELFAKLAATLIPRTGYLLLGASESIFGYSSAFELMEHRKSLYYRIKKPGKKHP
ncbi:MAG: protein-glutamate O-methyltransferase CheR [Lentisphaerae bacterium]|nr:protein-glutamate O-methyltransferase CheR [Lentisphaerota bacterium]